MVSPVSTQFLFHLLALDENRTNSLLLGVIVRSKRARNGGMAVTSKAAKATKSIPPPSNTAGQGQSPSCDHFPTSIAKRTRAQSTAPAGQRAAAKTDSSSKAQADEAPYSPDVRAKEEEEPIPGMNTQLAIRKNSNSSSFTILLFVFR